MSEENESGRSNFAAVMAVTGALLYLASAVFTLTAGIGSVSSQAEFWTRVAEAKFRYALPFWLSGLGSLCLLAPIHQVSRRTAGIGAGWTHWLSFVTRVVLVMHALQVIRFAVFNPDRADWYVQGSEAVRLAIEAERYSLQTDPRILVFLGFLGLWIVTVSLRGWRNPLWSKVWCGLGIATGVLLLLGMAGSVPFESVPLGDSFRARPLRTAGLLASGFVGPVWFLWCGVQLRLKRNR